MEPDFTQLDLESFEVLEKTERSPCPGCGSMRKYYCCMCLVLVGLERVPQVELPFHCTIVLCDKENRKKSSIIPVPLMAPNSEIVSVAASQIPSFSPNSILVFPGDNARCLSELTDEELTSISNAVFLDCTWRQTTHMLKTSLSSLPSIKLSTHKTMFWRYQNESETCLATVEAIYYFYTDLLKEKHTRGLGPAYTGSLDNLLWFYLNTNKTIQVEYNTRRHKEKSFRYKPGYILKGNFRAPG